MTVLVTDAIVLHVADYLESSRLLRLMTHDAGVVSVVARGARNSRKRFGSALDLFAEGQAQVQLKAGRDLHALHGFEVTRARPEVAADLDRFYAASALAEVVLRLVHDEAAPSVFHTVSAGFARLAAASPETVGAVTMATLWQLIGEVGYRPTLTTCADCHAEVPFGEPARFHAGAGGVLCINCATLHPGGRTLPPAARHTLARWLDEHGGQRHPHSSPESTRTVAAAPQDAAPQDAAPQDAPSQDAESVLDAATLRAHQRLAREFLTHQLAEPRPLRAYSTWESLGSSPL